jgi:hypothetical protein
LLADFGKALVHAFACVLLHVQPGNSDALGHRPAGVVERGDVDPSVLRERLVELRNLVTLGQVGTKVVLAGKDRLLTNLELIAVAASTAYSMARSFSTPNTLQTPHFLDVRSVQEKGSNILRQ